MQLEKVSNENKVSLELDDFKKDVCHSMLREHSFKEFWEKAMGLPPIDLNTLTANQFQAVGELAGMNLWDGSVYTPIRGGDMLSDCKGKHCHGLQPIREGEYFKVVIWYNLNDDKEKYRYYFFGLTNDYMFFDASYENAKDEPIAAHELREMFDIGSWVERTFGKRPSASPRECAHCRVHRLDPDAVITTKECFCDKFKKKHCNGWLESYDIPFRELWQDVWGLPPIDFNELNYAQVGSISRLLGYDDYSTLKPNVKRGKEYPDGSEAYFAIVDCHDDNEYACGLTSDYYFFEDNNHVDYPGPAKEMMELFPEAFLNRSQHDDEFVMRALGGLWGAEVEVSEHDLEHYRVKVHEIKSTFDSRVHDAIWRLSEYYNDETGMRELHCLERKRWPFRFYGLDETSYLRCGLEKKLVQWQREATGKAAAEFIRAFDSSSYVDAYNVLTDEQKAIVDGLRERGKDWLEIWKVRREIQEILYKKNQEARKKNLSSNTSRVNYGVESEWVRDKVAELLVQEKGIRNKPEYASVLTGTMHGQSVIVVEQKRW
jgi:hypothetical protein